MDKLSATTQDSGVLILSGHYGSGKTETAINMAITSREMSELPITLADLDIINPYFRSREKADFLNRKGIRLVAGSIKDSLSGVPALSGEIQAHLSQPKGILILDTGGDPEGVRLLGRYKDELVQLRKSEKLTHLFVFNPFRPETPTAEKGKELLLRIEESSGTKIDGIVCNGHFLKDTEQVDISSAWKITEELSQLTAIPPAICNVPPHLLPPEEIPREIIRSINLYMRDDWMS